VACRCVVTRTDRFAVIGTDVVERGVTTHSNTRETAKLVAAAYEAIDRTIRDGS